MASTAIFAFSQGITQAVSELLSSSAAALTGNDSRVERLSQEGSALRDLRNEVERSVAVAKRHLWVPTERAMIWLEKTNGVLRELDEFEIVYWDWRHQSRGILGCIMFCGLPLWSGVRLGVRATELRTRVVELKELRERLGEVAGPPPLTQVSEIPTSTMPMIGQRGTLEQILRCLDGEHPARIIGVCGMGGVGKTTLLKEVNNSYLFRDNRGYDVVIWATVSLDFNMERLQRTIADRLGLSLPSDEGGDRRALLTGCFSHNTFVLILDDVWEAVDLDELGIPATSKCKIVFTTRSDHVCSEMDADTRIQVDPLGDADSWELFRTRVPGDVLDSPPIRNHAWALVDACGGLPLALVTVGRAMAGRRHHGQWSHARRSILVSPTGIRGMEGVICALKLSFDSLRDDLLQRSLLHCCSHFPDTQQDIDVEALVDSLIEEGLLPDDNVEDARDRGYAVIGDLKAEFLLQSGSDGNNQVKIHPVVRSMALFIMRRQNDD